MKIASYLLHSEAVLVIQHSLSLETRQDTELDIRGQAKAIEHIFNQSQQIFILLSQDQKIFIVKIILKNNGLLKKYNK
jgi:hypothetical protein